MSATIAAGNEFLARCTSPAALSGEAATAAVHPYTHSLDLALSLNGQQYLNIDTFHLYAPAVPTTMSPAEGATDGATPVNVSGSLLGGGGVSVPRLCSFGDAVVQATHQDPSGDGSGGVLLCMAPSIAN